MDLHTGLPYWLLRSGLIRTYPRLTGNLTTDVAIIGAGITGAMVAYELTRAGIDVVVLDADHVASGSSAATSGLLLYDTDSSLDQLTRRVGADQARRIYQLGIDAIAGIARMIQAIGDDCGFSWRSSLYLASRRRDVRGLEEEFLGRKSIGLPVEWLSRKQVDATYSFSAPAAIRSAGTAEIDCYRLTHGLLRTAERAGARIHDRTAVTRVRTTRQGVLLETQDGRSIRANRIVTASGYPATRQLSRRTGTLQSTWAFVTEPLPHFDGWPDRCLIWETARPYLYIRSTDDGRLLAGGEDEPGPERHRQPHRFRKKIRRLVDRVRAMLPRLPIDVAFAWGGTFAITDDGLPYIGSIREHPHTYFALGYGGNGITFSAIAATILRDQLLGRPNEDAVLFSFDR